ncbi:MAG: nucleotidyltransferase domain-containing protein, partial [Planctomycetota bacterium]
MKFGLKETTIQKICGVFADYPQVEKAVIYGSRAKGNYKNGSDIDLTLYGGKDLTLNILSKMLREIDDLLLPYTIDLSIFHNLSDPDFIEHIQRVGMVFYQREPHKVLKAAKDPA